MSAATYTSPPESAVALPDASTFSFDGSELTNVMLPIEPELTQALNCIVSPTPRITFSGEMDTLFGARTTLTLTRAVWPL